MAISSENYADHPETETVFTAEPDELSDILQSIRLRGEGVLRSAGEFALERNYPRGTRALIVVESGGITLSQQAAPDVEILPGDMVLLARGSAFELRSTPDTSWITGYFSVQALAADSLLSVLPEVVLIHHQDVGAPWLSLSVELLLTEISHPRPGSRVMISRILDLLFVHALRAWSAGSESVIPGWLTGAMDEVIGPVLTAIHRDPQLRWTVAELAQMIPLSSSAFSHRFSELLGVSPGSYVAQRRLEFAANLLLSSNRSVADVARQAGYESAASFNRAFRRAYGKPPRSWRLESAESAQLKL